MLNEIRIEDFSKLAGSKMIRLRVCLFIFHCTPTGIIDLVSQSVTWLINAPFITLVEPF